MLPSFLGRGFFPSEMPPSFTTAEFADAVTRPGVVLPPGFSRPPEAALCNHSLARAGNARFRRRLSLVNPINYYALANCIATNWAALSAHLGASQLSASLPTFTPAGPRAMRSRTPTQRDLIPAKARNRAAARALLIADISEFYHSI